MFIILILALLLSCTTTATDNTENQKAQWIKNALESLERNNYPEIKAISWWHEDFDNSYLTVNSSAESLQAYKDGISSDVFISTANFHSGKLAEARSGIYHSAYPDFGGTEDIVSIEQITRFEELVNKPIVWAYFSNNWYNHIEFPASAVNIIHSAGKIPFIRIMSRTNFHEGGPDPSYTMQKIIDGVFDSQITQWAIDAKNTDIPLLVEFGTEVNGNWFPWNGQYNGGGNTRGYGDENFPDGPERFVDAYRHIIDICNANGAGNITWFFHVNAYSQPEVNWNTIENYYPGNDYIDWLGVSIYGPQDRHEEYQEFTEILNDVYPVLTQLSNKPIAILEFSITELE